MVTPSRAPTFVPCWLLFLFRCAGALQQDYPSEIRLSGGVLHSPPFAYIDRAESTGDITYRGFTIDLLERLKIFAAQDNIRLQVDLDPAPEFYEDAFDLVARDCDNSSALSNCSQFDLIVGDFYSNPERSMRADLSPPWLRSTTTTLKHLEKEEGSPDYTTLKEAEEAKATVCVPEGTFMEAFAWSKYPQGNYIGCEPNNGECVNLLKLGNCVLFVYDELILHHIASNDYTVQVTKEAFNTQYMVWPMSENLPTVVSRLVKKWLYQAVQNNTMDELYFQYFQNQLCPQGTAGKNCELPCDPDNGEANARGQCVCKSTKYTGDDCSIEVAEELNLLPQSLVIMCYTLVSISFLLVISFGAWFVYNRERAQVKITQPTFLMLILLGCVISTSTIIALAQEDPGDGPVHACMAIPWLYSVGFCLTFGAMFARIRRIYTALQYAAELTQVAVSSKETILTVGLVLAIDVAILTVWTVVDPLEWERTTTSTDVFGVPLESEGYCHSEYWSVFAGIIGAYHLLLMGTACYMTYIARNCPNRIANLKYVGIAMFSNLQIFLMVVPVLLVVGSDPQTSFLVRSLAIWINDFVVVGLIFGNFIYRVYKFDQENKEKSSRNLSVVASRVAVRESIVSFARNTQPNSLHFKSRPSLISNESKRLQSVRFSDECKGGEGVLNASWARRLSTEFDNVEDSARRSTEPTMSCTESGENLESQTEQGDHFVVGESIGSVASDSLSSHMRKGKSDSSIVVARESLQMGNSDSGMLSRQASDPDVSQHTDNSVATGSADVVLEKPDFRRHRSFSEPSLTSLKQKQKNKPRMRLDPAMPQHRFMELLNETYGQRAEATPADMPRERFMELLQETYGDVAATSPSDNTGKGMDGEKSPPKVGHEGLAASGSGCIGDGIDRDDAPTTHTGELSTTLRIDGLGCWNDVEDSPAIHSVGGDALP